jgi:hypothetical protein
VVRGYFSHLTGSVNNAVTASWKRSLRPYPIRIYLFGSPVYGGCSAFEPVVYGCCSGFAVGAPGWCSSTLGGTAHVSTPGHTPTSWPSRAPALRTRLGSTKGKAAEVRLAGRRCSPYAFSGWQKEVWIDLSFEAPHESFARLCSRGARVVAAVHDVGTNPATQ